MTIFGVLVFLTLGTLSDSFNILAIYAHAEGHDPKHRCVETLKTSGGEFLHFHEPRTLADWLEVIEALRTNSHFPDWTYRARILTALDKVSNDWREELLIHVVRDYRSMEKDPNRRSMELILNRLFRPDLRIHEKIAQGLSVEKAYADVLRETNNLIGDKNSYTINDIRYAARALQQKVKPDGVAYLIGSSVQGRGAIGVSDMDVAFEEKRSNLYDWFHTNITGRMRMYLYGKKLNSYRVPVQKALLQARPTGPKHIVEMHDITPGDIFFPGDWVHYGTQNTFVIVILEKKIELVVFAPPEVTRDAELVPSANQRYPIFNIE